MRILVVSPIMMALIACGGKPTAKREPATVLPFNADSAFAEPYFISDEVCQAQSGIQNVGKPIIYSWKDGGIKTLPLPIDDVSSVDSLTAPGFNSTVFSLIQRTTCRIDGVSVDCSAGARMVQRPQSLKICASNQSYARTSIEGVALSSLASLSLARQFYFSLATSDTQLNEANLIVLPTIETIVEDRYGNENKDRRKVMTDNLAYAPNFGGSPAFVVFPKGKRSLARGLWTNLNLWEMGWGMAHEFGHHVFRHHTETDHARLTQMMPIHSFAPKDNTAFTRIEQTASADLTDRSLGAINEGFADLFGYYTFGGAAGITKGIDCFEKSREVDSAIFFNGDPKVLSAPILDQFYGVTEAHAGSCTEPSYDDIHMIGAIIAHGIDRLLQATPGLTNPSLKSNILLTWAEAIGQQLQAQSRLDLADILRQLLRQLATVDRSLTSEQCRVIRDVFPAFGTMWLGQGGDFRCVR